MTNICNIINRIKTFAYHSCMLHGNPHTLVSWFISKSSSPTLLRGCELFITLLVSEPVYTTTPKADPDATTQFAQRVFSTSRLSSLPYPSCCNEYNHFKLGRAYVKQPGMDGTIHKGKLWNFCNMKQQNVWVHGIKVQCSHCFRKGYHLVQKVIARGPSSVDGHFH